MGLSMFKKYYIVVLVVLCIVQAVVIGGLMIDRNINCRSDKNAENDTLDDYNINRESFQFDGYKELCDYLYHLDICMLRDERLANSNINKCLVVDDYVDLLDNIANYYYDILLASDNEVAVLEAQKAKSEWEKNISNKINTYQRLLEQQYGGGTIAPLLFSKHRYMLYRGRAISAFELHLVYQV